MPADGGVTAWTQPADENDQATPYARYLSARHHRSARLLLFDRSDKFTATRGDEMARPRTREDGRREEIVKAALRLILKTGYNSVTLADIAQQIGVSKGLISYYFPKKDDVFVAVLEQIADRLTGDFESFYTSDVAAAEKLKMIFANLFGNEKRARRYYTVVIDYMAQAIRTRQVQEYVQLIYTSYRTYMERIVQDGVASGEFRQIEPERSASMILALMEGLVLQWFFDRKAFDLDEAYGVCVSFVNQYLMAEGRVHLARRASRQRRLPATDPPPQRGRGSRAEAAARRPDPAARCRLCRAPERA